MERDNDWGLKFLSLVIAVFLWAFVRVTAQSPFRTATFAQITLDLPLVFQGREPNLIPYEYSAEQVRVTLRGAPDVVESLRAGFVKAYVDLRDLAEGTHVPEVKVLVPPEVSVISKEPESVTIKISRISGKEVPVEIRVTGKPADDLQVGKPAVEPGKVKVRGPRDLVSQVDKVIGEVVLNGQSQAYSVEVADLRPVNASGVTVQGTRYQLRVKPSSVMVTIPVEAKGRTVGVPVIPDIKDEGHRHQFVWQPDYVVLRVFSGYKVPPAIRTAPVYFEADDKEMVKKVPLLVPEGTELIGGNTVVIQALPTGKVETKENSIERGKKE